MYLDDICLCVFVGPASLQCAETLRQNNYQGQIIIVTKDEQLPLDKTKLSKVRMKIWSCSICFEKFMNLLPPVYLRFAGKTQFLLFLQAMNIESKNILLRPRDFLKQHGIEVWTEKEVSRKVSMKSIKCMWHLINTPTCAFW